MRDARSSRAAFAVAAFGCLAGACSDDGPTGPGQCDPSRTVTIGVSSGTTPSFTWEPRCLVSGLEVTKLTGSTGTIMWSIGTGNRSAIASGVTFGVVPAGAVQSAAPVTLIAGEEYEVRVTIPTPPAGGRILGTTLFRP